MFKECKNLAELNAARVKAVQTHDPIDVNAAYNKRRAEILSAAVNYKKVQTTPIEKNTFPLMSHLPYIGTSDKPGCIEWTNNGFKA